MNARWEIVFVSLTVPATVKSECHPLLEKRKNARGICNDE